jgi:hypothetical protein
MHGFEHVDDTEERWKMGVEKVMRQSVLRLILTIVSRWYLLHLQCDPTSEGGVHDKVECFGTLYSIIANDETRELTLRTFSIFLLKLVNILLPLSGTSNRPCRAVRGSRTSSSFLHANVGKSTHIKLYLSDSGHRNRHEGPRQAVTQVCESPSDKDGSW